MALVICRVFFTAAIFNWISFSVAMQPAFVINVIRHWLFVIGAGLQPIN
jgi:hypothetical protein